jgi:hypothetical protein
MNLHFFTQAKNPSGVIPILGFENWGYLEFFRKRSAPPKNSVTQPIPNRDSPIAVWAFCFWHAASIFKYFFTRVSSITVLRDTRVA